MKVQRPETLVVMTRVYTCSWYWSFHGGKRYGMELMANPSREITTVAHGEERKALPPDAKNYVTFQKELLACYWVLIETQLFTTGYKDFRHPNSPL